MVSRSFYSGCFREVFSPLYDLYMGSFSYISCKFNIIDLVVLSLLICDLVVVLCC